MCLNSIALNETAHILGYSAESGLLLPFLEDHLLLLYDCCYMKDKVFEEQALIAYLTFRNDNVAFCPQPEFLLV